MSIKRFNISLPEDLIQELDVAAKAEFVNRSVYIREAVTLRLRLDVYMAEEISDERSDFNILKNAHMRKMMRRNFNSTKTDHSDIS